MKVSFLSRGSPDQISGGYLYNRYLIEHLRCAGVDLAYLSDPSDLAGVAAGDTVIVDSLVVSAHARSLLALPARLVLLLHVIPRLPGANGSGLGVLGSLYRRSQLVVTSDVTLNAMCELMDGEVPDVTRIEPGVPRHWRMKPGYADTARTLLGVANYVRGKGILRTLDVLAGLRDLPWTLTWHGNRDWDPEYFAAVAARVESYGFGDRVELAGPIPHAQVNRCMVDSDLLVHLSYRESYSMVTAEAIACGLPVLSYRTGNATAFGRSGLVRYVDSGGGQERDPLGSLIEDRAAYGRLRRADRWEIRSWEQVGREFLAYLEQH